MRSKVGKSMAKAKDYTPKSKKLAKINPDEADKIKDLENKLARALADYQNLQKQTARQVEAMRISSLTDFLVKLVEIYDDLRLAVDNQKDNGSGLEMILNKIKVLIEGYGCSIILPQKGEIFNNREMEAVGETELSVKEVKPDPNKGKQKTGTVAELIRSGLKQDDNILKPAQVLIYSGSYL